LTNTVNPNTPNVSGIYYQSWVSKIKNFLAGDLLAATWLVMLPFEGDNDGLVSINSAKWEISEVPVPGRGGARGSTTCTRLTSCSAIRPGSVLLISTWMS
jgi:hypothetical protein